MLDPWGTSIIKDYDRLYDEFGIEPFKPLLAEMPNPNMFMRRGIVFGHRDFKIVLDAIKNRKKFAVMSGIKPTGEFHLGTLMTAREIIYFQQQGAFASYCIADIEAYEDNAIPYEKSEKYAVGNVADLLALGFDRSRGYVYRQSTEPRVKDLSFVFGRAVTLATMNAIYGGRHIGLYMSALIQAGDILMPQLEDFGGPKPTVVPVGVDQDAHLRLCRDLAQKFAKYRFVSPSSTYHKIMRGLNGSPKMSKRDPMSYFTLQEKPGRIAKKVSNALTGGRATEGEQRQLGGVPEQCCVYEVCLFHFRTDDNDLLRMYEDCVSGRVLCGECKSRAIEVILKFITNHQEKRERLIDDARQTLKMA